MMGEHPHAQRGNPPDHLPADPADADDSERLAAQLLPQEAQAIRRTGTAGGRRRHQPPGRREHEADGVLGDRDEG